MSIVLSNKAIDFLKKTIGFFHHNDTVISLDNQCNTCIPDDHGFDYKMNAKDLESIEMLKRRIGVFSENDINEDTFYVVINRLSTQTIGSATQERAGYMYLLVRKSDNIPCMEYYARDNENVKNNFDHKWLKWDPEFANWFIYDPIGHCIAGKIVGSLLE
jgi:hypothetical protein